MRHGRRAALHALVVWCGALAACRAQESKPTLRFWALGQEGERVRPMLEAFERENPGIRVRLQQLPWTAAHEKLLTAYVGDATPDVAQVGNTWVPEFVALRALEPLDPWIASSAVVDPGAYFDGIWRTNVLDGTAFGIPWYVDTRVLFYRTDILTRAGYDAMPTTWQEWREAMAAVSRVLGPGRHAIFLPTNEWVQPVVLGLQAGAPLLRDSARYGAFRDSAFRRAFEFYVGLYQSGAAAPMGNNDVANPYQEFARGTFAMWITGPWNLGEFRRRLPRALQDQWATAPLPGPTGATSGVSLAGGSSLVLFRASARKSEGWKLIEFLSRADQQRRLYDLTGDLPARREVWQAAGLDRHQHTRAFWEQLHRVVPLPQVPEWELIATKVIENAERAIRAGTPADQVLDRLDRDVDRVLAKRRWLLARDSARGPGR
ncbi:MAG: sugar ABC transporter substrate-binding protein [Gemmatimonadales bacterium]|nr:sugar ABC transporter substrate-binding protein [Gemmatimonadales bacterium]